MFDVLHFGLFAFSVLMINLSPGSTFVTVSSNAMTRGTFAGVITALGAGLGLLFYAMITWAGISTFIVQSPVLFNLLRYAGAAYLLYCSFKAFTKKRVRIAEGKSGSLRQSFLDGVFVNLMNPLSIIFFLTVLPQFVNPENNNISGQLLFLGLWVAFSATVVNTAYALIFGSAGKLLKEKRTFWYWQSIVTGVLFLYLAVKFALKF